MSCSDKSQAASRVRNMASGRLDVLLPSVLGLFSFQTIATIASRSLHDRFTWERQAENSPCGKSKNKSKLQSTVTIPDCVPFHGGSAYPRSAYH